MAFSLALDQAQLAISDRRSALTVVAAPLPFPRIIPAHSRA